MHALKLGQGTGLEELRPLRHRAVSPSPGAGDRADDRVTRSFDDDDREAASIIALLADALEQVAATTVDPSARAIAEDALALFQGR